MSRLCLVWPGGLTYRTLGPSAAGASDGGAGLSDGFRVGFFIGLGQMIQMVWDGVFSILLGHRGRCSSADTPATPFKTPRGRLRNGKDLRAPCSVLRGLRAARGGSATAGGLVLAAADPGDHLHRGADPPQARSDPNSGENAAKTETCAAWSALVRGTPGNPDGRMDSKAGDRTSGGGGGHWGSRIENKRVVFLLDNDCLRFEEFGEDHGNVCDFLLGCTSVDGTKPTRGTEHTMLPQAHQAMCF